MQFSFSIRKWKHALVSVPLTVVGHPNQPSLRIRHCLRVYYMYIVAICK